MQHPKNPTTPLKGTRQTSMTNFFTKKPSNDASSTDKPTVDAVFRPPTAEKPQSLSVAAQSGSTPVSSPSKVSPLTSFSSGNVSAPTTPNRVTAVSNAASSPKSPSPAKRLSAPSSATKRQFIDQSDDDDSMSAAGSDDEQDDELDWRQKKRKIDQEQWKERNKAKYQFLEDIMDEHRRKPDDPDYDPRTLFIPNSSMMNMTNFEKQYWEIKSKNWDTIVLFNKGMFYEIFESDAEICQRVLGLTMTDRAGMRMVGMPKTSYESFVAKLIAAGYKVARVEQKETPIGRDKQQRMTKSTESFKETLVLKRELDRIISPGTVVEEAFIADHNPVFLLSIVENQKDRTYGICLVDTSRSEFTLGRLDDDLQRTLLKTLLLQTRPKEFIFIKSELSKETQQILKNIFPTPPPQTPRRREEWWDSSEILDKFKYEEYFAPKNSFSEWPQAIQHFSSDSLVMSALGGCVAYLHQAQLDKAQVSMRNFLILDVHKVIQDDSKVDFLILDGKALANLEILENEHARTKEGTLLEFLDYCSTPFGRRMMKRWICRPLKRAEAINDRLNAVSFLLENREVADALESELRKFASLDLERLLSRCHSQLMNLADFLRLLDGFELVRQLVYDTLPSLVAKYVGGGLESIESSVLASLFTVDVTSTNSMAFPDFDFQLRMMFESFNLDSARNSGKVQPAPGVDSQYDAIKAKIDGFHNELESHLEDHRKHFKTGKVVYTSVGKDNWVIEVPKDAVSRYPAPKGWIEKKGTQKVCRYWTNFIVERQRPLAEAMEEMTLCENHLLRSLLLRFDQSNHLWQHVIRCISEIDCFVSLARVSGSEGMCRPIVSESAEPELILEGCKHPCLANRMGSSFVPNTISLNSAEGLAILLTGPNMGGKSTVLRQVCVAVIMAQMGCYVMAESMSFTPVDRVFTRIGASDNIFEGQSTFLVELLETASICNFASKNSLVILDELGRGTSTHDGYAIAFAVLNHLMKTIKCRTLFSTHYHKLTDEWKNLQGQLLQVCHMAALVNNVSTTELIANENIIQKEAADDAMDIEIEESFAPQDVVFLYQIRPGGCPRSYGLNVAHLANLPESVLVDAAKQSEKFFQTIQRQSAYENPLFHT